MLIFWVYTLLKLFGKHCYGPLLEKIAANRSCNRFIFKEFSIQLIIKIGKSVSKSDWASYEIVGALI